MKQNSKNSIPEGWTKTTIGKVIIEQPKSKLQVGDAVNFGNYPFFTSGESVLLHDKPILDGENLYIATGGSAIIKYFNGKAAYSTDTYAIKGNNINSLYLYFYLFKNTEFINQNYFSGSGLKHLQKKDFKKHLFLLPASLSEQQQIAAVLSAADQAIASTEELIAKYRNIKTGLLHNLLTCGIDKNGNIRSPKTHKFKQSPLGLIPQEWECGEIGELCYVTKLAGFEFTKYMQYRDDGEIIALRAMNIKNEELKLNDIQRISKKVSDFLVRSKIFSGDILITYIGAYIGDILQIHENNKYHLAPNIAKIVVGNKITSDFAESMLRSERVQNALQSVITATANPSLTMGQLRKINIIYPTSIDEQNQISEYIRSMNCQIKSLQTTVSKLRLQKAGLMSDLLSGKVRVTQLMNNNKNNAL